MTDIEFNICAIKDFIFSFSFDLSIYILLIWLSLLGNVDIFYLFLSSISLIFYGFGCFLAWLKPFSVSFDTWFVGVFFIESLIILFNASLLIEFLSLGVAMGLCYIFFFFKGRSGGIASYSSWLLKPDIINQLFNWIYK